MGPKQLAGVMDIVARNAAAGRGDRGRRGGARRADRRCSKAPDRDRVDRAVRHRPGVGRRDHPSRPTAAPCSGLALSAAHSNAVDRRHRVRSLEALTEPPTTNRATADRQPWRDRRAHRSHRSPAGDRHGRRLLDADVNALHVDVVDVRSPSAARPRPTRTCVPTPSSAAALDTGVRRSPPRLWVPGRERRVRPISRSMPV